MQAMKLIRSQTVVLPLANIDTDQIIPARFLRATTRAGFGAHLFADWRYDSEGAPRPDFVLNQPSAKGCTVLVAGRNFGCGSSREHAAWALTDYGFRAVISTEFADIFRTNALKNGLVPVRVEEPVAEWLIAHPGSEVEIDLENTVLRFGEGQSVPFPIEPFARYCLLNGIDELGFLHSKLPEIEAFERTRQSI